MKADEISCELTTIDGNRGLALSPVALGESYRRLQALGGWSLDRIAEREGKSSTTIAALIRLTGCSVYIKSKIHADAISYVAVLSLLMSSVKRKPSLVSKKMIAELEKLIQSGIKIKKTPREAYSCCPFRFLNRHVFHLFSPQKP